jgi:hypothetical protein
MEELMRMFLEAVAIIILSVSAAMACPCEDLGHANERPLVFQPETPPADAYEVLDRIELGTILDEEGGEVEACIIHLVPRELPPEGVPTDEYGFAMILLDDGMTFIPQNELQDMVNPNTCSIIDPEAGDLAGLFLYEGIPYSKSHATLRRY